MSAVNPVAENRSTFFHTFRTDPHVVSTRMQPMCLSRSISCMVTPTAGRMTPSPGRTGACPARPTAPEANPDPGGQKEGQGPRLQPVPGRLEVLDDGAVIVGA